MEGNRPGGRAGWFGLQIGVSRWSSQPWDWSEWRAEPVREQKPGSTNADRLLRRALQQRDRCGVGRGVSQGRELEGRLGQLCQEAAHKAWELPSGRGRMTIDGVTGCEGTR